MTRRVGIIGLSEGNGHPFSFSAIINGYSHDGLRRSGWPVIFEYVRRRDPSEFGIGNLQVTHAWTQVPETTARLCAACRIPNAVSAPEDMIGAVDAIILARDDYSAHFAMAMPYLEAGLPVFVDKPLTLDLAELAAFRPYLESGQLMSCSAMRFARELDGARANIADYGELRLIRGAILNDWERYGIHLVDAVLGLVTARPLSIAPLPSRHASLAVSMDDGSLVQLDALGNVGRCFRLELYGTERISSHEIIDNFSMFRRLLAHFARGIATGEALIPCADTLTAIRMLIAGRMALEQSRKVHLDELRV